MTPPTPQPGFDERPRTVAHLIARFLARRGSGRIWGLTGGHIKPIWDESRRAGIEIVDVRHEAAAVHMAQAEADLTGRVAVATVTTGPGFTNALSGIGSAALARSPVVVLSGLPPSPQIGRGAFEDVPQVPVAAPLTLRARTLTEPRNVLAELDEAFRAAAGEDGPQGPVFLDVPIDVLRAQVPASAADERLLEPPAPRPRNPDPAALEAAAELLRAARRPLVISGRGAVGAAAELDALLRAAGALHLETKESRGLLPAAHPAGVTALRGRASAECDLLVTVGRRFDFELAYGSTAMFSGDPRILRIGRGGDELRDNRPGDVEVAGDVAAALAALAEQELGAGARDAAWLDGLRAEQARRSARLHERMAAAEPGADGRMHPYRLLSALNAHVGDDAIVTLDGGDVFSFARIGLAAGRVLDPGAFGCLGVGVPFAVAAALVHPERTVVSINGDGAFGFNPSEVSTAVRHGARVVFVVANNEAFNIERTDQRENFGGLVFGTELPGCRYDLVGRGLGAHGERVEDPAELPAALERAFVNAPAVLDVAVTRDARSPDFDSGLAELPDLQALRTWDERERAAAG